MSSIAALFSFIACTLLAVGVLWGLAHIFGEIAGDRIWRRRATWQFGTRSMLAAVVAASLVFGVLRMGLDVFFTVIIGLVGIAAFGAVVRILFLSLNPRSEPNSASALREPSQPIGPPPADEAPAAQPFSEGQSARQKREPRQKWWLKRYDPTLTTKAPRF